MLVSNVSASSIILLYDFVSEIIMASPRVGYSSQIGRDARREDKNRSKNNLKRGVKKVEIVRKSEVNT